MSNTTIIILLLVALGGVVLLFAWPRDRTHVRLDHVYRVTPQDLWDVVIPHPDRPNLLFAGDRYDWDAGSSTDADLTLSGAIRGRFSQRVDPAAMQADQTILATNDRGEVVDRILWRIAVLPAPDGARIVMDRRIEKAGGRYPWHWTEVPFSAGHLRNGLFNALTTSGAFARYDAAHGTLPPPRGARLWWMASVLAAVALGWWFFGPWLTVALVAGLVLHEAGHVAVMRAFGDRPCAFQLLPFAGSYAVDQMQHATAWQRAAKLLGGSMLGFGSAVMALLLGWLLDSAFLTACGYGFMLLNLAHLAPIPHLDRGQLIQLALKPFLPGSALRFAGFGLLLVGCGVGLWGGERPATALLLMAFVMASLARVPVSQPPHLSLGRRDAAVLAMLWLALTPVPVGMLVRLGGEDGFREQFLALMRGPFQ